MELLTVVLAPVKVGHSVDPRRCVVVGIKEDGGLIVIPCSSQFDLYRPDIDFAFPEGLQAFSKPSYAIDVDAQRIRSDQVKKVYGKLEGQTAADFLVWLGELEA